MRQYLTHPERLAVRRLAGKFEDFPRNELTKMLELSPRSTSRVLSLLREKSYQGNHQELRQIYISESKDGSEVGWLHCWVASLEFENKLLSNFIRSNTSHETT